MLVRYEPFGAWVKLESMHAIVALSREGVRALGLDGGAVWEASAVGSRPPRPVEVHLAVTARCAVGCKGCYLDARPDGDEPTKAELLASLDAIRASGAFTVALGGGEPTLRADLVEIAEACRERGLTPVLTTSGHGLSPGKIERLRAFAQVNVSYDGTARAYAAVRGYDGAASAEEAIVALVGAGVRVGVNVVLTRMSFPSLEETVARARSLGAKEAQLLRYKPAGRAASLDYLAARLSPEQIAEVGPRLRKLTQLHSEGGEFSFRIDCAMVPFLAADEELYAAPERLQRWGVMGCEAASALTAVKANGHLAPCSFAGDAGKLTADLAGSLNHDSTIAEWRSYHAAPPSEPCASCNLRPVCKGGCQVVSSHLGGEFAPDPECPRVAATPTRSQRTPAPV